MNKLGYTLLSLVVVALLLGVGTAAAQDAYFDVGYFTNANASGAPSAQLRLTNDGGAAPVDDPPPVAQNMCANIYVFDNAEEMQECCSCEITPDGYLDLAVNTNLLGNILDHGTKPTRGFIAEVSTLVPLDGCTPLGGSSAKGIKGWLTHVQKGATSGTFSLTETPLTDSSESGAEIINDLLVTCEFVQSLGTGTGVCSCTDAGD
jgi:hypothetical protein